MIPAAFDYEVAESADHAISLLGEHGEDAKLLAGGHSLLPLMRLRLAAPSVLVDIGRIGDLNYVRDGGDHVAVGALTTMEEAHFSELLQRDCPILAHTAGEVGDPQVRHRGTVGGTVAHADPASDIPTVLLALDATLVVQGAGRGADGGGPGLLEGHLRVRPRPPGPAHRDPGAQAGRGRLELPEVPPQGPGLGDRGGGRGGQQRRGQPGPDQHGGEAPAGQRGRAGAGLRVRPGGRGRAGAGGHQPAQRRPGLLRVPQHLAKVLARRAIEGARSS